VAVVVVITMALVAAVEDLENLKQQQYQVVGQQAH
jgi:hypothetical protein